MQPTRDGAYQRACEADGWRGLVAALRNDPGYESADVETRLVHRLEAAHDAALLAELIGLSVPKISDRDAPDTINVSSDEPFIRSLHRAGLVSLEPRLTPALVDQV